LIILDFFRKEMSLNGKLNRRNVLESGNFVKEVNFSKGVCECFVKSLISSFLRISL
jgi:hypothetical protein